MAIAELNKKWWEKNKPDCLKKSEIDKCITDYDKTVGVATSKQWKIDGNVYEGVGKAIEAALKAVGKDLAEAKKAKDKDAEKLLNEVQKDVESKKSEAEKFKEIKKDVDTPACTGGAGGGPPSAALAGEGGAAAVVEQIINAANTAWTIIKDGKPVLQNATKFCQALPKDADARDFSGWKTFSGSHTGYRENGFGINVIEYDLTVSFQYQGTSLATGGWFVNNFTIFCKEASVLWGFTCNIDASVSGAPYNSGKPEYPIGAIPLLLSISTGGFLNTKTKSYKYTAHGNGALEV
jgi:hypothetical protein